MSIFNRNVIRYYENITTPRVVPGAHDDIAMVVNMFTREAFTQHYDYMQVYYHGGGVYTFMALVVDNASGLRIAHGPILDAVLAYQPHTRKTKTVDLSVNPFTGEQIALNLRIKTLATCVINNDEETLHPKYLCIIIAIISVPAVVPFPRITSPNATPTKTPAATPATTKFSGTNTGQSCVTFKKVGNSKTANTV